MRIGEMEKGGIFFILFMLAVRILVISIFFVVSFEVERRRICAN